MPFRTSQGITGIAQPPAYSRPYTTITAGPPVPVIEVFIWTLLSFTSFMCFLILPGRLRPKINIMSTKLVGYNDFAYAGVYMHVGMWVMTAFELVVRGLCHVLLSAKTLAKLEMLPIAAGPHFVHNTTGEELFHQHQVHGGGGGTATAEAHLEQVAVWSLARLVAVLRAAVGAAPLPPWGSLSKDQLERFIHAAEANAIDPIFSYHGVLLLAVGLFFVGILLAAYCCHIRLYLQDALEEQRRPGFQFPAECKLPRQYKATVRFFPAYMWIAMWCTGYAAAFGWVRGLPILAGMVVPALTVILVLYDVLIP